MVSPKIFPALAGAAALAISLGIAGPVSAALCTNTTDCTLLLTQGNAGSTFLTGSFGTVHVTLAGTTRRSTCILLLALE